MEKAVKVLLHGLTSVNTEVIWEAQDMAMSSPHPSLFMAAWPFLPHGKDRVSSLCVDSALVQAATPVC